MTDTTPPAIRAEIGLSPDIYFIRKRGLFFRSGAAGYTDELGEAGQFSKAETERYRGRDGLTIHHISEYACEIAREIAKHEAAAAKLYELEREISEIRPAARKGAPMLSKTAREALDYLDNDGLGGKAPTHLVSLACGCGSTKRGRRLLKSLKRKGYVALVDREDNLCWWQITDAGRAALKGGGADAG